jgi:hypothetical protein
MIHTFFLEKEDIIPLIAADACRVIVWIQCIDEIKTGTKKQLLPVFSLRQQLLFQFCYFIF